MNERRGFIKWACAGVASLLGVQTTKGASVRPLLPGERIKWQSLKVTPKIRVWKLGNLEERIWPTPQGIEKLANILKQWYDSEPGSDLDLIWGPDLEVTTVEGCPDDIEVIVLPDGRKRIIICGDKDEVEIKRANAKN